VAFSSPDLSFSCGPSEELPATVPSIDGESSIHEATVSYGHFKPSLLVAGTEIQRWIRRMFALDTLVRPG
jgi:hypothetical protein